MSWQLFDDVIFTRTSSQFDEHVQTIHGEVLLIWNSFITRDSAVIGDIGADEQVSTLNPIDMLNDDVWIFAHKFTRAPNDLIDTHHRINLEL